jgi:ABC-type multidrug transport system ATPase subunit
MLMITETPTEMFRFATQLTSQYDDVTIETRVNTIIARLGLENCKDTVVGGYYLKGLSGGERKRASIGYELVTNPRVLLLDEPTSGLDSSTAYSIGKLLRQEAERGMAILCTIHSPSSDLFQIFDRVILLSAGYTIYNGPTN